MNCPLVCILPESKNTIRVLIVVGIRLAQRAGVTSRGFQSLRQKKPLEAELYKRVFWVLVTTARRLNSLLSLPKLVHSTGHDSELVLRTTEYDTP